MATEAQSLTCGDYAPTKPAYNIDKRSSTCRFREAPLLHLLRLLLTSDESDEDENFSSFDPSG